MDTHPQIPTTPIEQPDSGEVAPTIQTPGSQPVGFSTTPTPPAHKNRNGIKSIVTTLTILFVAPLIAITMTTFVFQSYEVDGPSMETTLQNQDRLIVLKLPRTLARISGHSYIPNRGDVVIFNESSLSLSESSGQAKQLIKRVVGLPGERVVVSDGILTVYNKESPEGFQPDKSLPYGSVITTTQGDISIKVGPGQVFVCGDNRGNSLDSRYFGAVDANQIVGKLAVRIFPFNKAKIF